MDSLIGGIIGAVLGVGGIALFGWLRGRRSGGSGASAGAARRAQRAHAQVDEDLATKKAKIDSDREADHAAANGRWKPGGRP